MGGKVGEARQLSICHSATAVGSECVYSLFDPIKIARLLTCIHERAIFPGFEELLTAANGYLVNYSSKEYFLMSPLHSLTMKIWIFIYYMPYF